MLIFEEHFQENLPGRHFSEQNSPENSRKWVTRDDVDCSLTLKDNCYLFDHKRSGDTYWLTWNSADFFYDRHEFQIHITLEKSSGTDGYGYGFVWGVLDTSNFFEFIISGSGLYRITHYKDGILTHFANWKKCDRIQIDNRVNILGIRKVGDFVDFYINSTLVETLLAVHVMDVLGKSFGFVIHDKIQIKIHNLIISSPEISKKPEESRKDAKDTKPETKANFVEHEPPTDDTLEKIIADLNALIGHEHTKEQLLSLANFLKVQTERKQRGLKTIQTSLHLMLYGPPGTGKTTIARLVGRLYKQLGFLERGHVVETDRAGIIGGYIGQTALRVESAVQQAIGGVLFIDEAYMLVPDDTPNDFGKEAIQVLLKRMEDQRDRMAVVVAGYADEMEKFIESNPGLKSRINRFLYIDHYQPDELLAIFKKFCIENGYSIDLSAYIVLQKVFFSAYEKRNKTFGNGRYVRTLFERSIEQQANRIVTHQLEKLDNSQLSLITGEDLYFLM
ncbi:AAA ATPase central domain-containing protein [Calothrix sp. NIES-4101]|nr:AAA ATPase central domain-containing protein [Calothrix sp. NIES-4101]